MKLGLIDILRTGGVAREHSPVKVFSASRFEVMYPDGIAGRNTSSAEMYTNVLGALMVE